MFFSVRESKLYLIKIIILVTILKLCACHMEKKVVGGALAKIKDFPHALFIEANCGESVFVCGASILNQKIIITAGHCLDGCDMKRHYVAGYAGSADFTSKRAIYRRIDRVIVHSWFTMRSLTSDIGLARVQRRFPLNDKIKRLIIPRSYPNTQVAKVAGWGSTVFESANITQQLKFATQAVRSPQACSRIIMFSYGMFCTGPADKQESRPTRGDSGSALVTADRNQLGMGIVSYGDPKHPTLVVYTNLTYHYNWILDNAKALYCNFKM